MGKLIKLLVVAALLVGGIVLAARYGAKSLDEATSQSQSEDDDRPEIQEKYGIAPAGGP